MLRDEVRSFLQEHFKEDEVTDKDLIDLLELEPVVASVDHEDMGWWTEWINVHQVGDRFVTCPRATSSGDESATDRGWEFNFDLVVFAERVEVQSYEYRF